MSNTSANRLQGLYVSSRRRSFMLQNGDSHEMWWWLPKDNCFLMVGEYPGNSDWQVVQTLEKKQGLFEAARLLVEGWDLEEDRGCDEGVVAELKEMRTRIELDDYDYYEVTNS